MPQTTFRHIGPWHPLTILTISILFTPVVGSLLAAYNLRRMGYPKAAYKYYVASLIGLGGLYYMRSLSAFVGSILKADIPRVFLFPPVLQFLGLIYSPLLVGVPLAFFLYLLLQEQMSAWRQWHVIQYSDPDKVIWWHAYLTALILVLLTTMLLSLIPNRL